MTTQQTFRVPRSRVYQWHQTQRDDILQALEPVLFGSMQEAYVVRERFERAFAAEMQQPYAVAVHSGTIGLFLALLACGVGSGDEVITVGNSDISTTAAIRRCGAVPVLCDIQPSDFTIDPTLVEARITSRTRALLPVDMYGHPANVKALRAIADAHGVAIVEDAALAAGAYDHGQPVGHFADVTVFSFAPYKPLGSVSNGAVVVTADEALYERIYQLARYGAPTFLPLIAPGQQYYAGEGLNVPLDGLQAALLLVKLPYLAAWTEQRQALAAAYAQRLAGLPVHCPSFRPESAPTFRGYTIRVARQADVFHKMIDAGIEVVLHYVPAAYRHPAYADGLPGSDALPETDRAAAELLGLPLAPELTEADVDLVVEALTHALV